VTRHPLLPVTLIAVIVLAGLVTGLTGDSYEDLAACVALALALLPIAWAYCKR
jgi:hypothetical protein